MAKPKNTPSDGLVRAALPSDGEMHEPALAFFRACGLEVSRPSSRRYSGSIPSLPGVTILFQRAGDIPAKVEEGSAELGVTGLDRFREQQRENGDAILVVEDLGYSRCELVLAVPEAWADVTSTHDLGDLSVSLRESGRELRIATKYPRLVQRFLYRHGVNYFSLVQASGTLEAAPLMGYADMIADISSSGTTLRENRLKTLDGGTILISQACLIGNRRLLRERPEHLALAREMLERMEAYLAAGDYYRITVNIRGESQEAVVEQVLERPEVSGLHGPTVAPVFSADGRRWFNVTVVVHRERLMTAVDHFRSIGGSTVTVSQASYLFYKESKAYRRLLEVVGRV